jgi:2-iminobutanoate/2-iminopropanoate deaminase
MKQSQNKIPRVYSNVRRAGHYLFSSGQSPIDSKTGKLVEGQTSEQVVQVMENIKQLLQEEKLDFSDVVKTTVFLTNMDDFLVLNQIYGRYFKMNLPARSCVVVSSLPYGAYVEIEFIACDTSNKFKS